MRWLPTNQWENTNKAMEKWATVRSRKFLGKEIYNASKIYETVPNIAGLSLNQDHKSFTVEKPLHHIHCSLDPRQFAILDQKKSQSTLSKCLHPVCTLGLWGPPTEAEPETRWLGVSNGNKPKQDGNLDPDIRGGAILMVTCGMVEDQGPFLPGLLPEVQSANFPDFSCGSRWPLKLRSAFLLNDPVLPVNWENKSREGKSPPGQVGQGGGGFWYCL